MKFRFYFLMSSIGFLSSCFSEDPILLEVKRSGKLHVVTRNAPTTYYELHDELTGFEYDLVTKFTKHLNVEAHFIVKDTLPEILETIDSRQAHMAAAGLTDTIARNRKYIFAESYQKVQQQIVCRRGGANPKQVKDLVGLNLVIPAATSYLEQLKRLTNRHPKLVWHIDEDADTEHLLKSVWLGKADCTIADSNIFALNQRYYPELTARFNLTKPQPLAWLLPANSSGLQDEIEDWLDDFRSSGKLDELIAKYYGYIQEFDYVDTRRFTRRIATLLPKYKLTFKQAAKKYHLDWTLLAAQAYQESHWRANAKSPTGVRGIMMLTLTTAKTLGIESRLNPEQSIWGGARYLKRLYRQVPDSVREPDRTWFALAAYNVGMGHIHDARTLAIELDKNPNLWTDLSTVLPLLSQKILQKSKAWIRAW